MRIPWPSALRIPLGIPLTIAASVTATTTTACDGVAGPDYNGESLATVSGTIEAEYEPPPVQAVLVWADGEEAVYLHEAVEITSTNFPAEFQLAVYTVPDELYLIDLTEGGTLPDESRIAFGLITVMRQDADLGAYQGEHSLTRRPDGGERDLVGAAENHVLVYVESDVEAGTLSEELLGGTLSAGFHLMAYAYETDAQREAYQVCYQAFRDDFYAEHPNCDPEDMSTEECQLPGETGCTVPRATMTVAAAALETVIPVRVTTMIGDGQDDPLLLPRWPLLH
jgi:hypothetical protein